VEHQEKPKPNFYHAALKTIGTLLPLGEERKLPAVRLEGLEEEVPLKRKRLSPFARKFLRRTLQRYLEGARVGLTLWPRTWEGRLDLTASQVGHLYVRSKPERRPPGHPLR
jgi:hypothetical protein